MVAKVVYPSRHPASCEIGCVVLSARDKKRGRDRCKRHLVLDYDVSVPQVSQPVQGGPDLPTYHRNSIRYQRQVP